MKAIQVSGTGGPEVLEHMEVPDPHIEKGEALLKIEAIGVNFIDIYVRSGRYPRDLPLIPGFEAAGTVVEVGVDVHEVSPGDLVAFAGVMGSYAEIMAVPSWQLVKLPEGVDIETGAALIEQGLTAHYLCRSTYPLGSGDTALVHAGAGGVGLLLIQMAKRLGATVITTVSTEAKAARASEAGADHVIIYTEQDFEEEVNRITGGRGLPVVYDSVGASTFDKSLACLAPRGYMVLFGQSSGPVPTVPVPVVNAKSLFFTRPTLGHYAATREELLQRSEDIFQWVVSGDLKVQVHDRYPLREAAEAHRALEGRQTTGKLLLVP